MEKMKNCGGMIISILGITKMLSIFQLHADADDTRMTATMTATSGDG